MQTGNAGMVKFFKSCQHGVGHTEHIQLKDS